MLHSIPFSLVVGLQPPTLKHETCQREPGGKTSGMETRSHSARICNTRVVSEERFIRTDQGLLIRTLNKKDSGMYLCQAVEHGFMQMLLKVTLEVIDTERLEDLLHRDEAAAAAAPARPLPPPQGSPNQKLWYRDFLTLVNHPTLSSVDEFCEQVWKRERKHRRQKAHLVKQVQIHHQQHQQQHQQHQQHQQQQKVVNPRTHAHAQGQAAKWKHLQERQKGRNRRTHELERAPRSV
ncbi:Semaphorin-3ab [Liparis tanakae]|uniref:Semaphorin-3ab n=1 Tax=Liparis tanakae TaxID=230148 RepID=A0A4Z2G5K8_9TELE|nr:Semaphorin-3ab [Liparis tanakae]